MGLVTERVYGVWVARTIARIATAQEHAMQFEDTNDVDVADELLELESRLTAASILLAEGDAVAELIHEAHHLITTASALVLGRQTRALRQAEQIVDGAFAAWQSASADTAVPLAPQELFCHEAGCHCSDCA